MDCKGIKHILAVAVLTLLAGGCFHSSLAPQAERGKAAKSSEAAKSGDPLLYFSQCAGAVWDYPDMTIYEIDRYFVDWTREEGRDGFGIGRDVFISRWNIQGTRKRDRWTTFIGKFSEDCIWRELDRQATAYLTERIPYAVQRVDIFPAISKAYPFTRDGETYAVFMPGRPPHSATQQYWMIVFKPGVLQDFKAVLPKLYDDAFDECYPKYEDARIKKFLREQFGSPYSMADMVKLYRDYFGKRSFWANQLVHIGVSGRNWRIDNLHQDGNVEQLLLKLGTDGKPEAFIIKPIERYKR